MRYFFHPGIRRSLFYFLIALSSAGLATTAYCATITSTTSGGDWEQGATWVGEVVPNSSDDVIIAGTVSVGSNKSINSVTVNKEGILQNGGTSGWITLSVNNAFLNNGTVRNNPSGNEFWLDLGGDVTNNGIWTLARTHFSLTKKQTISQAISTEFRGEYIYMCSQSGYTGSFELVAGSDLTFNLSADFNGKGTNRESIYENGRFDMAGHNLTLKGKTAFYRTDLTNVGVFVCRDSSSVNDIKVDGPVTLGGRFSISNSNVVFNGDVTVRDTLQNSGTLGWVTPVFNSKFINNGTVRNNSLDKELWLDLGGDVTNNGIWTPARTHFSLTKKQTISQAISTEFRGEYIYMCSQSGYTGSFELVAGSDLTFNLSADFNGKGTNRESIYENGRFDMAGHNLTLKGKTAFYRTDLTNVGVFVCRDSSSVNDIKVDGPVTLGGRFSISNSNVVFNGDVTVRDTLQNSGTLGWVTPVFNGKFINNGIVRNNPSKNELWPYTYGDIENNGTFICNRLYIYNFEKPVIIDGTFDATAYFDVKGGKEQAVARAGARLRFNNNVDLATGKILEVPSWGELCLAGEVSGSGTIINHGTIRQEIAGIANGSQKLSKGTCAAMNIVDKGMCDSLSLTAYATAAHPKMHSSVRRWWRIESKNVIMKYSLVLTYADSLLNGNNVNELQAYLSKDNGTTWTKISNPLNTRLDTFAKTVTIGNVDQPITEGAGDIVLSSGAIVQMPSISTSIIGNKDIRVGPPNLYTVAYWNNSSVPTGSFFLTFNTEGGIRIKSASVNRLDSGKVTYPADSLMPGTESNSVLFFVSGLAPNEMRTIDLVLTSDLSGLGKRKATMALPLIWVAAAWVATAVAEEYASNYLVNSCYEMWRPYEQGTDLKEMVKDAAYQTYRKTNEEFYVKESVGKKVAEEVVEKVERSIGRTIASPAFLVKDIMDCMGNMVDGMKDYVNGGFDKNERSLRKVTSWDPNAKAGPAGYGDSGYVATAAPVTYTIFFENKKEATAPAYKIVVIDTLDEAVFDASTVVFGNMSHNIGVAKRNNNVLTWEFEGIELVPNQNPPEGEGWVQFTVSLKPDLPTGTRLSNTASITFDINKPLITNKALNILDFDPPVTNSIKATYVKADTVEVTFSAADSCSGVKVTNVFMSRDDAPFSFAGSTHLNKFRVAVIPGSTCRFYVQSEDNVGNLEKSSPIFEATSVLPRGSNLFRAGNFLLANTRQLNVIRINFGIKEEQFVKIKLFNLNGQTVATLANSQLNAGTYSINWNHSRLGSGAYIIKLSGAKYQNSTKIFLIK